MDFKKLNTILYRFSSQFRLGNPNIVNSLVMNIDYLIVNFSYFSDLGVVLEYFLSDNPEFKQALSERFDLLFRNLKYRKDILKYKVQKKKKEESTPKKKQKGIVFDNLDEVSKNKVMLWRGVLGGLTLKKFYSSWIRSPVEDGSEFNAFTLNEERDVYESLFRIFLHHYDLFSCVQMGPEDLEKILRHLEMDSAQDLVRRLLCRKSNSTIFHTLRLFESARACEYLLGHGKYYELLQYLETAIQVSPTESQSSDEEESLWDEITSLKERLVQLFHKEKNYFVWNPIYRILEILLKRGVDVCVSEHVNEHAVDVNHVNKVPSDSLEDALKSLSLHSSLKYKFYIRLLCLSPSFEGIFRTGFHLHLIRLFFDNPNDSFYASSIYKFFKKSIGQYREEFKAAGFFESLEKVILKNVAAFYEGRPRTEAIFPFCVYLSSEDHLTSHHLASRIALADSLSYYDLEKIDSYLEDCISDVLVRYVCNVVVDRMPVLSAYLSKDHPPVDFAETKREKNLRLGGGMQDTL